MPVINQSMENIKVIDLVRHIVVKLRVILDRQQVDIERLGEAR